MGDALAKRLSFELQPQDVIPHPFSVLCWGIWFGPAGAPAAVGFLQDFREEKKKEIIKGVRNIFIYNILEYSKYVFI